MSAERVAPARAPTRYRPTEPADLPHLSTLFADRFGHPLAVEEWEWKYRRTPGESRSWVAVDGRGRIAAHAGALCLPARLAGGERGIWQLTDWAGAAAGGGLRPPLVTLGRRLLVDLPRPGDAPWIFGFPSARHFRLGQRVFGYRPLAELVPLRGALPAGGGDPARIESGDRCGEWAHAAWEACGVRGVRRSAAFLNWRYHARPGRYYRVYRLRAAAGGTDGLAVFAFVGRLALAAELWLPPAGGEGTGWMPTLLAVAADLAASGLETWEWWPPPPGAGLAPLLGGLGLAPTGERRVLGCRGRGGEDRVAADPAFAYAMGDHDLI